jgi:hypothetical protein
MVVTEHIIDTGVTLNPGRKTGENVSENSKLPII